jgi:hypothetical protein
MGVTNSGALHLPDASLLDEQIMATTHCGIKYGTNGFIFIYLHRSLEKDG